MDKKKSKIKAIGRIVILVLISLIIGLMVYTWNAQTVAGNAMPMPFGVGLSVVLSGSMKPELSVNDLVIVVEADNYNVGDTVVYQSGSALVIHKIIAMDGDTVTTKGTANNVADDPINVSAIKGKAVAHIPFVGIIVNFLKSTVGTILLIISAVVLFELPHFQERKKVTDEQERIKEEIRKLKGE